MDIPGEEGKLGSRKTSQVPRPGSERIHGSGWASFLTHSRLIPGSFPGSFPACQGWILIKLRILINSWSPKRNQTLGGAQSRGGRAQTPSLSPIFPIPHFLPAHTRGRDSLLLPGRYPKTAPKQPQNHGRNPRRGLRMLQGRPRWVRCLFPLDPRWKTPRRPRGSDGSATKNSGRKE